jgi:hypothetical protein
LFKIFFAFDKDSNSGNLLQLKEQLLKECPAEFFAKLAPELQKLVIAQMKTLPNLVNELVDDKIG